MQIFVRGTAKLLAINVESDDTVNDVYEHVAQQSGYAMNDIFLTFHGTLLDNTDQDMEELNLVPGAVFDVSTKILGGKTHGGLNHVGKVRNGTPKVPPQEKQKKKTGRARRREQYAQRFANKVASPTGYRVGPNSNHQPGRSTNTPLNGLLA